MQTATDDVTKPAIKVRRMDLQFSDTIPMRWAGDNAVLTATLAGLAVAFPAGERFFIASVRHYLPEVTDPALREAVHAFIGQEAQHTKEHVAFNKFLAAKGLPVERMEKLLTEGITKVQRMSSPQANLARTAALEHFTAILAGVILEHRELLDAMPPEVAKLFAWHAVEEIEHRAVAFDVYRTKVGDEALRRQMMLFVTALFVSMNFMRSVTLFRAMKGLADPGAVAQGLNVLWGKPGIFRKIIPRYMEYFRGDFHPSNHDYGPALEETKRHYLGAQA